MKDLLGGRIYIAKKFLFLFDEVGIGRGIIFVQLTLLCEGEYICVVQLGGITSRFLFCGSDGVD